jgi:hypothetical protein
MKIYKDLMLNKYICLLFWELSLRYKQFIFIIKNNKFFNETLIEFISINYVHVNNYNFYLITKILYVKKGG